MRIGLLLLAAWLTLLLINTALLILPITIGRAIFASFLELPMIHGAKCNGELCNPVCSHSGSVTPLTVKSHKSVAVDVLLWKIHYPLIGRTRWYVAWETFWTSHAIMVVVLVTDLYAFNIGCYVFWATAAAVRYVIYYLRRHALGVLQRQILKWSAITAKSIVLLSLWVCLLHLLLSSYCCLCNSFLCLLIRVSLACCDQSNYIHFNCNWNREETNKIYRHLRMSQIKDTITWPRNQTCFSRSSLMILSVESLKMVTSRHSCWPICCQNNQRLLTYMTWYVLIWPIDADVLFKATLSNRHYRMAS